MASLMIMCMCIFLFCCAVRCLKYENKDSQGYASAFLVMGFICLVVFLFGGHWDDLKTYKIPAFAPATEE